MDTSPSLLERLKGQADPKAWDRFVELYTPLLYRWAHRAHLQQADAEDLVQDVLAVLVQELPQFVYDKQKSFRNWLLTVTRHKYHERNRRRRPVTVGSRMLVAPAPAVDDLGEIEEKEYRNHLVQQTLQKLQCEFSENTWKAFDEHVTNGRDADVIARELGVTVGAIYVAKSRILSRIRQELHGLLD